ncbi:MAG: tripartite tricarboxylate transporter permease [Pseudomonadota bacterium]
MDLIGYIGLGISAVFSGPELMPGVPITPFMILAGFFLGIVVGATPGLAGPMAMAVSLPILISVFGYTPDALLPVLGFMIGIMKGATLGGSVPAILFNTPGTPDAYMTTLDGYPMARAGQPGRALRIAHVSSATGDTFSDLVLILCAPFLAIMVERYLDLPEKTALLILSLAFIATVIGRSVGKGLISLGLGLFAVSIGTGEDFYPRLSMDMPALATGFSVTSAVLGVLIIGEVFKGIEDYARAQRSGQGLQAPRMEGPQGLAAGDLRRILPYIARSSVIGTIVGALPGVGSTLAATLGYSSARATHSRRDTQPEFGSGAPEGIAATEAANSSVSGANLIPVLSLGIPGNAAAVFLILAMESIGGFNPGPSVFRFSADGVNPELVIAFGLFTAMMFANLLNWTVGGVFMRLVGVMVRIPRAILLPVVLLLTLTSIYVGDPKMSAIWIAIGFGVVGYAMRRIDMSPLPFVIAFILGSRFEDTARQSFEATGGNPWFLFSSPVAASFMALAVLIVVLSFINKRSARA